MQRPVAIVIPCFNEERYIGRCLDSILASDYDHRLLDVVVVDGMSTDRTREIIREYAGRHPCIRLLDNPGRIKPTALNLGIANTTADVVMRMDAHALYERDYIRILVHDLDEHGVDNTGGVRETDHGQTTWSKAVAYAILHPFAAGNAVYRTGVRGEEPREVDTVFCGCYRRDVFERIGLFNERLIRTQDREFNERLRAHGGKILLNPAARCFYFPRLKWSTFGKWIFQGSYWLYYASRFTETPMTSWRNRVPPLFVIWHLLTVGVLPAAPGLAAVMSVPIVLYWVMNALFSIRAAVTEKRPLLMPYLMFLFAATHYSYGAGAIGGWLAARWQGKDLADCSPQRLSEFRREAA